MQFDDVMRAIGQWGGTLKYFPGDSEARLGIAKEIAAFVPADEQLDWLISAMSKTHKEWPGILEVRAVFCARYRPADGVEATLGTSSPAFAVLDPEAIHERKGLPSANVRLLPGDVVADKPFTLRDLLADAMAERKAAVKPKVPIPTDAEIAAIKAQQQRNRTAAGDVARLMEGEL